MNQLSRSLRTVAPLVVALILMACGSMATSPTETVPVASDGSQASGAASASPRPADGAATLLPPSGRTWFGMNLDWANQTIAEVADAIGVTPATWVQFVRFPLDEAGRANLAGFFEQVGAAGGHGLVTLEPHDGLAAVTAAAAAELAAILTAAWEERGVATFVRFAHEMNGSWYPWAQQPAAYVEAFRVVADAIHSGTPASAMVWAPNDGAGYPFTGGTYAAAADDPDLAALDTDGDGALTRADDPYAPYWPGDDAVDWVGMSAYFWGLEHPWGENEIAPADRFVKQLTGQPTGAHADEVAVPDFYATYAEGHDKPMAVIETAALYDPAAGGPDEAAVKSAWFEQVFSDEVRERFDRIGMINWFEWHKHEPEVDADIDWRLGADPELARALLGAVSDGWLAFATTTAAGD